MTLVGVPECCGAAVDIVGMTGQAVQQVGTKRIPEVSRS